MRPADKNSFAPFGWRNMGRCTTEERCQLLGWTFKKINNPSLREKGIIKPFFVEIPHKNESTEEQLESHLD
jgi:hypothetical protein